MSPVVLPVVWLGGGILLMLLELMAPGAFLVWIGLAAFGTGLAALAGLHGFEAEVVCFAVLAAACIAVGLRVRRRPAPPHVNLPESGLTGRSAEVLSFDGAEGRVRVGDSDWPARLVAGGTSPPPGARLRVVGVEGLVVLVAPSEERA